MAFVESKGKLSSVPKGEPTVIKYNPVVNNSGEKGALFSKPNLVAKYQRVFQSGAEPIHLKTPRDRVIYSGVMYGSLLGLLFAGAYFAKIALPRRN